MSYTDTAHAASVWAAYRAYKQRSARTQLASRGARRGAGAAHPAPMSQPGQRPSDPGPAPQPRPRPPGA